MPIPVPALHRATATSDITVRTPAARGHAWRTGARLASLLLIGLLTACSTLGYYTQLAGGEAGVLLRRKSMARLIADPATDPALKARLQLALRARAFASDALQLPRNRSYTLYADIQRPYVMYNVFATPELSLRPLEHCFPIAGCVAYQGFYKLARAQAAATKLRKVGDDVYIGGVTAYSTLGHFADPVLSSMNRWSDDELVGTIFHELAHQKIYVKGDTTFNESFATFVQREGLRQWHRANHLPPPDDAAAQAQHAFTALILATRERLRALYASALPAAQKRRRKQSELQRLRADYRRLRKTRRHGLDGYAAWIAAPLNNASLLPFGLYDDDVPAFRALFAQCRGNWVDFHAAVARLAQLAPPLRQRQLQQLGTPRLPADPTP